MPGKENNESLRTHIMYLREDIKDLKKEFKDRMENMEQKYVTKDEFEPIKKGFYGILAAMIAAVIGSLAMLFGMKS